MKFKKGVITTDKKGLPIDNLGDAMDLQSKERCCGPDCCDGVYRWVDVRTGAKYAEYVKNGVKLFVTQAVFDADKAASFLP